MKQIYSFLLVFAGLFLFGFNSYSQEFTHKEDLNLERIRSSSDYRKTVKFADLFTFPSEVDVKSEISTNADITINFSSTNESNILFDGYYYSIWGGQYFYCRIPTNSYGKDTLTITITYNGIEAISKVVAEIDPIECKDDAYDLDIGDTLEVAVTSNDNPKTFFDYTSFEIIQNATSGTYQITGDGTIEYINPESTPNYTNDTIIYRIADTDSNYDTAMVVMSIHKGSYVTKVFDYLPAPGQFVNKSWADPAAGEKVIGNTSGGASLGGFGGYIIVGFEQAIVNRDNNAYGVDFTVKGNAFGGWAEPAAVQVMKDENSNGLPDDTWYELAGSEYYFKTSIKNLTMTYYNPKYNTRATIPYSTNEGINGAMRTNSFHNQPYYPDPYGFEISKDSVSYTGTLSKFLLDKSRSGFVTAKRLPRFGYADNKPNGSNSTIPNNPYTDTKGNGFDLEWAVDAEGNYVDLDTVHFVKVYSTVQEDGGWLGEVSPEIFEIGITTPDPSYVPEDYYVHSIGAGQLQVLKGTSFQYEGILFKNGIPQEGNSTWSSTIDSVGVIDNTGLFTANKLGTTTLRFHIDPAVQKDSITIEVVDLQSVYLELEGNTNSPDSTTVIKGSSLYINAQGIDNRTSPFNNFVYESYNWTSTNPEIGTITNGLFYANQTGTTSVIATSVHYPDLADTMVVEVLPIPVLENVSDTIEIAYEQREGSFSNTDLFSIEGGATIFMESLENANSSLMLSLDQNELNYELALGVFGYFPVTFTLEAYNEILEKTIVFKAAEPETQNSLVFLNGGQFMDLSHPSMLIQYNPSTNKIDTVDNYIAGATSVQDMLVDGNYAFVSADYYITRYDLDEGIATDSIYTQDVSPTEADGTGTEGAGVNHKMAIYNNLLLATRQFSSAAPQDGYNVRIYNKGDLTLVKKIAVSDQATDVVVAGDTAYLMINGGFAGTTSSLAVIDLKTLTLNREIDLGEDGLGVMQMIVKDSLIYGIRLASFMGTFGSGIITYNINTGVVNEYEYTAGISYDSSPLAIEPMFGDTIFVKKDLGYVAFNTNDNTFGTDKYFEIPSYYTQDLDHIGKGSTYNPEDGKFYIAYAYWHGTGVGQIYNSASDSIGSFEGVGASPEVAKIADIYEGNNNPTASGELAENVKFEEQTEIVLGPNIFEDSEDIEPTIYLYNPVEYEWLSYDIDSRTLTANLQDFTPVETEVDIVLQAFDSQGAFVTETLTLYFVEDQAPVVLNAIEDVVVLEDADDYSISLENVFTDVDNEDTAITKSIVSNSNNAIVLADISGNELTLSFIADAFGKAEIVTEALSNGLTITDTFVVTVSAVDDAPMVANPIADVTARYEDPDKVIDISNVFTDVDDETISVSILSNSNQEYAAASLSGSELTINFIAEGATTLIIEGSTNDKSAYDTVFVNVVSELAPVVTNSIADITANEDDIIAGIDIELVFDDPDSDNAGITKAVKTISNSSLLSASIDGNSLSISLFENQFGTSEVVIEATSNGLTVTDTFMVTVNAVDDAPVVANPITEFNADEDETIAAIDISTVFDDIDNDNAAITKTVQSVSNRSLLSASIDDNNLSIELSEDEYGTSEVVIEATSNGLSVTDTFTITVNAVDDAPVVTNPIADISAKDNARDQVVDISNLFTDVDDETVTVSVLSNSNPEFAAATLSGTELTIDFIKEGTTTLIIEGSSNSKSVNDIVLVTVVADQAPEVANPIADISVIENAADSVISLVNVFTDADDDDGAITKTVVSNSNDAIVTASITGNELTLSFVAEATGEAEITVEGISNGKSVAETFTVTINPATGMEEVSFTDIVLYPNPSNGILRVNTNLSESCEVRIFNMNGNMVYAENNYTGNKEIDISNQPSGQYILTIKHGNSIQTLSIIKK